MDKIAVRVQPVFVSDAHFRYSANCMLRRAVRAVLRRAVAKAPRALVAQDRDQSLAASGAKVSPAPFGVRDMDKLAIRVQPVFVSEVRFRSHSAA